MTPVDQEFLHDPDNNQYGDCQRAVIASLLDLPISEVPNFNQIAQGDPTVFYDQIQKFLQPFGYGWLTLAPGVQHIFFGEGSDCYHEISGPSPRNNGWHAVVGKNGSIEFDPHPEKSGLAGERHEWQMSYLVKLCGND